MVVEKIVSNVPTEHIKVKKIPENIKLADPSFGVPGKIDLLLGADIFFDFLKEEKLSIENVNYKLQNSVFGWLIYGSTNISSKLVHCGVVTYFDEKIDNQLKKFWEIESIENKCVNQTKEETHCEEHFNNNFKISIDGKFTVALPFKKENINLGDSSLQAKRRFLSLEKKFKNNEIMKEQYKQFMKEYIRLGHMEEIKNVNMFKSKYYLPHHCVLKPDSTTTKLRVVFDASCKTDKNVSLNSIMHSGPKLQEDLFNILLRFRKHRYVFTADIEKMFRQIWIRPEDEKYQLIYWRDEDNEILRTYTLKTVTYGTAAAPYLAVKCLQKIAELERNDYPEVAEIINVDFYMDDLMTGGDNLDDVKLIQDNIKIILRKYGFNLRKWCSNNIELLKNIPLEDRENQLDLNKENNNEVKALGVTWTPFDDHFHITCNWKCNDKITKRTILSDVSKLFDPLGFVNPVTVTSKILLQEMWKSKTDWDEKPSQEIVDTWLKIKDELPLLNQIRISRRILCNEPVNIELHGFCDASMKAYGAVVYAKSENQTGETYVNILAAKSRVAPIKIITLPRLELCAAVLLVELIQKILESLKFKFSIYFYTDSTIVLNWLQLDPGRLQIFVSNRVNFIQTNTNINNWRHIGSKNNPADIISRGVTPSELITSKLWLRGPEIIYTNNYKIQQKVNNDNLIIPEIKKSKIVMILTEKQTILMNINHKNSFEFLQNVTANIFKFIDIIRKKPLMNTIFYKRKALNYIICQIQKKYFDLELKLINSNKRIPKNSKLATLAPIVDSNNIIRVGGRIQSSNLSEDAKHPILLPYEDEIVRLLVNHIHVKHLHIGPQGLLAITRQKFWILRVGMDFLGPIWIHHKIRGKKADKAYVCVFVCFSTKAVHLEIVSDLSSAALIDRENQLDLNKENNNEVKALGITWTPFDDHFHITCNWKCNDKITKRTILSDVSKLFDPLGFVNPVTVTSKILLQEMWKSKTDWDEKPSQEIVDTWLKIKDELPLLNQIRISRRILCNEPVNIELHGFCDASMKAQITSRANKDNNIAAA
ncbi:uncharacterized protein LOC126765898 [Bactrocera neohumeralis]|uniref:uncharacterized protein LOC126765898 n=1 Tax=Bactrocera neohumeralis TaxID=98809 RepID=UPI00216502B6|nr:uncharacterized protein LOC126765898 [Bactrocera neohumeralis]